MKATVLLRNLVSSSYSRNLVFPRSFKPSLVSQSSLPLPWISSSLRYFTSKSDSSSTVIENPNHPLPPQSNSYETQKEDAAPIDVDNLSKEELKMQIDKFIKDGDAGAALPVFEAILRRRLTENHDESESGSDNEPMSDIWANSDKEIGSDSDE